MPIKKIISKILLVAVLIVSFFFLTKYSLLKWGSLRIESDATITVTGTYTMQIQNQVATYNIGINATNANKETALNEVKTKSDNLVQALQDFGIDSKDMQTTGTNVYQREEPYYENGVQKYRKADWYVNTSLSVTLRDINRVQEFSDKVYAMEISDLNGPYYTLDLNSSSDVEILAKAMDTVEAKARALAQSKNLMLGEIVSIREDGAEGTPIPLLAKGMGAGGGGGSQPGSSTVTKSVTVTYKVY